MVDASATGHVVGQLAAPQAINELVQVGMVRDQTEWMLDILTDPAQTGVGRSWPRPRRCRSTRPSSWSARLDAETDVDLAAVIVNRVLPELFGRGEEALFDRLRHRPGHRGAG